MDGSLMAWKSSPAARAIGPAVVHRNSPVDHGLFIAGSTWAATRTGQSINNAASIIIHMGYQLSTSNSGRNAKYPVKGGCLL